MEGQRGTTLFELIAVLAVLAVLAAVAVPGAARARSTVSGAQGARRLALVLRAAQAQAQSAGAPVRVAVGPGGDYVVTRTTGDVTMSGSLGASVTSTYPAATLEFSPRGWAGLPGASSPRAGHYTISGSSRTVVVQLSGCVRCT
jgi:prepilin-type N-terminal cleavage/methylation domain-containing protein